MKDVGLWSVIGVLLVLLVYLQVRGVRAVRELGVKPSRAVVGLRVFNTAVVLGLIAFMFWMWVK